MNTNRRAVSRPAAILSILLIFALLLTLSSCGFIEIHDPSETTQSSDTTDPGTTAHDPDDPEKIDHSPTLAYLEAASDYIAALPAHDLDGAEILFYGEGLEKLSGADGGTIIGLNRGKRNTLFNTSTNGTISFEELPEDIIFDDLSYAIESGEAYCDLIMIPQHVLGKFVTSGLLLDLSTLDCQFAEQPYFNYSAMQSTGGGPLYAAIGDASYDPDYLYGMFFNKKLVADAELVSPYELVRSGNWTWDKFTEYMATVGTANAEAETKISLHACPENDYIDSLWFGAGNHLVTSLFGATPVVTEATELSESFLSKLTSIFHDKSFCEEEDPNAFFGDGNALFYSDLLLMSSTLSDSNADWGIVPMPKSDADQESYLSLASANMPVIAVPSNVTDLDKISYVISAYFASSYRFLGSAYAEHQMSYYLRDADSIDMIYTIVSHPVFDAAYMYGENNLNIAQGTYTTLRYAVKNSKTMESLQKTYAKPANNSLAFLAPTESAD